MVTEKIRIAYDGPILSNGTMDVLDLAPALLAFGGLVQRVNKVIGNDFGVSIMLKADNIHKGSFDIQLEVVQTLLDQVKLFSGFMDDSGWKALIEVMGYGTSFCGGIFWLIKKIKGRKISAVDEEGKTVKISIKDDDAPIIIPKTLYDAFLDYEVRTYVDKITAPLRKGGINTFEIRDNTNIENKVPVLKIEKEERYLFEVPPAEYEEIRNTIHNQVMVFSIVGIVFDENQKWRFNDGDNTFWAKIEDETFWKSVENGEKSFTKGDRLKVEFTTEQIIDKEGKLNSYRTINKVIEHMKANKQITLDFAK